jgi:hypothetical protein
LKNMDEQPITRDWLAANNALARDVPRPGVTQEGRRSFLAHLYDEASARIGGAPRRSSQSVPKVKLGEGTARAVPAAESDEFAGGAYSSGEESDGRLELVVYGLGRALERATQEARGFLPIYVGEVRR